MKSIKSVFRNLERKLNQYLQLYKLNNDKQGGVHFETSINAVPSRGSAFSLEGPTGKRFLTRGRVFSETELTLLDACPAPTGSLPPGQGDG